MAGDAGTVARDELVILEPLPLTATDAGAVVDAVEGGPLVVRWLVRDVVAIAAEGPEEEGGCGPESGWLISAGGTVELQSDDLRATWFAGGMACRPRTLRVVGDLAVGTARLLDGEDTVRVLRLQNDVLIATRVAPTCVAMHVENYCGGMIVCQGSGSPVEVDRPRSGVDPTQCLDAMHSVFAAISQAEPDYDEALESVLPVLTPSYVTQRADDESDADDETADSRAQALRRESGVAPAVFDLGLQPLARPIASTSLRGGPHCRLPSAGQRARAKSQIERQLLARMQEGELSEDETAAQRRARLLRTLRRPPLSVEVGCVTRAGAFLLRATHPEQLGEDPGGFSAYYRASHNGASVELLSEPWYGHDVVRETTVDLTGDGVAEILQNLHMWESEASAALVISADHSRAITVYSDQADDGNAQPHLVRLVANGGRVFLLYDWETRAWNGTQFATVQDTSLREPLQRRDAFRRRVAQARTWLNISLRGTSAQAGSEWLDTLVTQLEALRLSPERARALRAGFEMQMSVDGGVRDGLNDASSAESGTGSRKTGS